MKVLIILSIAFLPLTMAADIFDPTKICFPHKFQATIYDTTTFTFGTLATDYLKGQAVISYEGGSRTVLDLLNDNEYVIDSDGSCTRNSLGLTQQAIERCLPANAVLQNTGNKFGSGSDSLTVESYGVDYGSGLSAVIILSSGHPTFPVARQIVGNGTSVDLIFYFNGSEHVNHKLFQIPAICPDGIVVGK